MRVVSVIKGLMNRLSSVWQVARGRVLFSVNGTDVINPSTAMKVSGLYRGVIYISSQIGKLPIYVKDAKNVVLYNDPVTKLIGSAPNDELNSMDFWMLCLQTAILQGNHISEIERDLAGRPKGIHPIENGRWTLIRDANGKLKYRISNFNKPDSYLDPMNVLHIKNLHLTADGLLGEGIVAYASRTLGIVMGADKMANGLFKNSGMPSGILEIPGTLSDEAYKRLKENWQSNQNDDDRKAGVALLEEGTKFNAVSLDPDVMQFLESRKFGVLELSRFLGLHPVKMFDIEGAKFANMENGNLETVTDCLDTWARRIEREIDVKLLNYRFNGRKAEIDTFELTRGDMTTRAEYYSKRMQNGSLSPNEIREFEGEAGYDGGDRKFIAANNLSPMDRLDEIVDAQVRDKSQGGANNNDENLGKTNTKSLKSLALALINEIEKDERKVQ